MSNGFIKNVGMSRVKNMNMYLDAELLYMTIDINRVEEKFWVHGNKDSSDTS